MKKFKSVLDRVDFIENKFGIYYAKTDGALYKTLKFMYFIAFAYTFIINLMWILGTALRISDGDHTATAYNYMISLIIFTSILIIGVVLLLCKINIIGSAVSFLPIPFITYIFGKELIDSVGLGPFKDVFYYRHLIPLSIMAVICVWMFIIALRAYIKRNNRYKQILKNLYDTFKHENPDNLSLDDWKEFVDNYNPRAFKELEE